MYVGSGVTPPAVTLWPRKLMDPENALFRIGDQAMLPKSKKHLPEMEMMLNVVFAGHL
jgi:hypothetical protein